MSRWSSNLLHIEFVFIFEKIIFLGVFNLKLPKWDTFEAIKEESFVRLLTFPSVFLRAIPLLLRCNLLLLREELFMWLLSIKRIPFPLHRFSSFFLSLLISSSKSWQFCWMTFDKTISVLSFSSFSLITFIILLIFYKMPILFINVIGTRVNNHFCFFFGQLVLCNQ